MWCQRPGVTQRKTVRPGRLHQHVSVQPQRRRGPPIPSASAARVPTASRRTPATPPRRIRRIPVSLAVLRATPPSRSGTFRVRRDLSRSDENRRDLSRRSDGMRCAFALVREMLAQDRPTDRLARYVLTRKRQITTGGAAAECSNRTDQQRPGTASKDF